MTTTATELTYPEKDPAEELVYEMNFVDALAEDDTIASATVTITEVDDDDETPVEASGVDHSADPLVRVRLSGGTAGKRYRVRFVIVTTGTEVKAQGAWLPVETA